jgi:hypothetical protein
MKKIFMTAFTAIFAIGMVSCSSINIERATCDKACDTAKNQCIERLAKDKEGKVSETKKSLCETAAKKCNDKCAKEYGTK